MIIETNPIAESKRVHTPELLEAPSLSPCSNRRTLTEGAFWLIRARAGSQSLQALRCRIQSMALDGQEIEPLITRWKKSEEPRADSGGDCGAIDLHYCGQLVLSIDGLSGPFAVGPAPYPGGLLDQQRFCLFEYPPVSRGANARWQYLLIAQPPAAHELEQLVNSRVSGETDEVISGARAGDRSWAPVFPTEGGWAVGGVSAIREIRRLRECWNSPVPAR
jgi:hypothetical protein